MQQIPDIVGLDNFFLGSSHVYLSSPTCQHSSWFSEIVRTGQERLYDKVPYITLKVISDAVILQGSNYFLFIL